MTKEIDHKFDIDYTDVNEIYEHYTYLVNEGIDTPSELLIEALSAVVHKYDSDINVEDAVLFTIQRNVMKAFNKIQDDILDLQKSQDEKDLFEKESDFKYEELVENYARNGRRTYKALYQTLDDIYKELSHENKDNVGFAFLATMDAFKKFQENAKVNKK